CPVFHDQKPLRDRFLDSDGGAGRYGFNRAGCRLSLRLQDPERSREIRGAFDLRAPGQWSLWDGPRLVIRERGAGSLGATEESEGAGSRPRVSHLAHALEPLLRAHHQVVEISGILRLALREHL